MKKLILIDSNALVHRAFHALPPTLSQKGFMTNAIFGFTSILMKMFKDLKPDYIFATFDLSEKTFRHDEFADYKAHRAKAPDELYAQIPPIKDILRAFGIPIFEKGGFEADDLVGALSEKTKKIKDTQTIIVTGDLDTLQLVDDDKVVIFTLRKGITDTVIYDDKEVKNRYGLKPEQVTDFKGLKGDPSDNIPGVAGVGEKTASTLIQKYGTIENLYEKLEKPGKKLPAGISEKLKEKLLASKDMAFFSKKLATIRKDVPIDFDLAAGDWRKNANPEELNRLFKEYGFFSLSKRLGEIFTEESANYTLPLAGEMKATEVKGNDEIGKALAKANKSGQIALERRDDTVFFNVDGKESLSISLDDAVNLKEVLSSREVVKVGHDLKPLIKRFFDNEVRHVNNLFDTKIAFWLLNTDLRDYSLERAYNDILNKEMPADRTLAVLELKDELEKKIEKNKLNKVFYDIEMPLTEVLGQMENWGVKVDKESVETLSKSVNKEINSLESKIHKIAGTNFNINSPGQLSEVLFNKLGIKGKVKRTSKGAISTAAGELEKLIDEHEIIPLILRYREIQKLKSTYIEPFPEWIDAKSGRIHTTFNQTGSATGRLASIDPNLQNIPIKTELGLEFRKAFIAPPKYKLLSLDYSQLELRIAAHISGDEKMTAAFKKGEDIHTRTAAEIYNVEPKAVTPAMRRQAKVMNFGLIYGMGILGFQRASGVSREKAREFIDAYMSEFSGVAKYMEDMKRKVRKDGYVETIFGRKRFLPEINSGMPMLIAQAERIAINMPIQGTNADIIKLAMIEIYDYIKKNLRDDEARVILTVHDELLFEVKNDCVKDLSKEFKKIMEGVAKLNVPLIAEAKVGDNWRDMELV